MMNHKILHRQGSRWIARGVWCVAVFFIGVTSVASLKGQTPVNSSQVYEDRVVKVSDNDGEQSFHYRLLRPKLIEGGKKYPLVLFLHGAGERGSDNTSQLKYMPTWMAEEANQKTYPCFVVAPQCRNEKKWVDVDWGRKDSSPQSPMPTTDMVAAIKALEEIIGSEPIDTTRIYLTGLSMGGYGSWDLVARMPNRFAAVVPVCGGGDEKTAPLFANVPVWCFHGDADKAVPVEHSRRMIAAIKSAGGTPKYSELPGVGHDSWTPAYRDPQVLDWIFSQRREANPKKESTK